MKPNGDLDEEELHEIRDWLRQPSEMRQHYCPFGELADVSAVDIDWFCDKICKRLFPKIGQVISEDFVCPCNCYTHSYVVRKARLILCRKGKFRKGGKKNGRKQESK